MADRTPRKCNRHPEVQLAHTHPSVCEIRNKKGGWDTARKERVLRNCITEATEATLPLPTYTASRKPRFAKMWWLTLFRSTQAPTAAAVSVLCVRLQRQLKLCVLPSAFKITRWSQAYLEDRRGLRVRTPSNYSCNTAAVSTPVQVRHASHVNTGPSTSLPTKNHTHIKQSTSWGSTITRYRNGSDDGPSKTKALGGTSSSCREHPAKPRRDWERGFTHYSLLQEPSPTDKTHNQPRVYSIRSNDETIMKKHTNLPSSLLEYNMTYIYRSNVRQST